jgi:hypothetical protein
MNSMQTLQQHHLPVNLKSTRLAVVHKKSNTLFYDGHQSVVPSVISKLSPMRNAAKTPNRNIMLYHKKKEGLPFDDFKNGMSKYHKRAAVNKSLIVKSRD